MTIVRVGHRSTAMTEGSREFCNVLETVSAGGVIIPPFIVWQEKTSYCDQHGKPNAQRLMLHGLLLSS